MFYDRLTVTGTIIGLFDLTIIAKEFGEEGVHIFFSKNRNLQKV